jgi:hypothetical protein
VPVFFDAARLPDDAVRLTPRRGVGGAAAVMVLLGEARVLEAALMCRRYVVDVMAMVVVAVNVFPPARGGLLPGMAVVEMVDPSRRPRATPRPGPGPRCSRCSRRRDAILEDDAGPSRSADDVAGKKDRSRPSGAENAAATPTLALPAKNTRRWWWWWWWWWLPTRDDAVHGAARKRAVTACRGRMNTARSGGGDDVSDGARGAMGKGGGVMADVPSAVW